MGTGFEMINARSTAALVLKYDIVHVHLPELFVEKPLHSASVMRDLIILPTLSWRGLRDGDTSTSPVVRISYECEGYD